MVDGNVLFLKDIQQLVQNMLCNQLDNSNKKQSNERNMLINSKGVLEQIFIASYNIKGKDIVSLYHQ